MKETTLAARTVFAGRLLRLDVVEVELDGGGRGVREIVRHPGAAAVLLERPDGRFVFVRQFRQAVEETLLEIVAGTLNAGEDPRACAAREVREETGYTVARMRGLGVVYPAPGYTSERLHLFHAVAAGEPEAPRPEDDEKLETVVVERAEAGRMMGDGRVRDAKTLAAWALFSGANGERSGT